MGLEPDLSGACAYAAEHDCYQGVGAGVCAGSVVFHVDVGGYGEEGYVDFFCLLLCLFVNSEFATIYALLFCFLKMC